MDPEWGPGFCGSNASLGDPDTPGPRASVRAALPQEPSTQDLLLTQLQGSPSRSHGRSREKQAGPVLTFMEAE